ncbi:MAG: class I SAM-dependent RNA methyltransferase [Eubacteriaceae bacterium]|jgi:putative N6-adenine-specific DNA methylase|nr:class I SAM-dependent RNA methyltransferase [Eubacteriaceae bacterium]
MDIQVSCSSGLESVVRNEMGKLGYSPRFAGEGLLGIEGKWGDVHRLNLWLRCASRVLLLVGQERCETFDELYSFVKSLNWEDWVTKSGKIDIARVSASRSALFSKSDIQAIAKKAICDRLTRLWGFPRLSETGPLYPVVIDIDRDQAKVFLNTSGPSLHRRGYSLERGMAPLKETLAASLLELAHYRGEREFADPMCGSGTIPIEAALKACSIAPGKNRSFAFLDWGVLKESDRGQAVEEARSQEGKPVLRILASDVNPKAVAAARMNARRAGVEGFVQFQCLDAREFRSRKRGGLIAVNPPYAKRLGSYKESYELNQALSRVYRNLEEWDIVALSAFDDFQKAFGKKADKNRKLYTGGMQAYAYLYYGRKLAK